MSVGSAFPGGYPNPATMLEGRHLPSGWTVGNRLQPGPDATGGNFSIGYLASHTDGRQGFLKALNLAFALHSPDPATELQAMTEAYNFEREVLERCGLYSMDRVVRALDHGIIEVEGVPFLGRVNYIIFERADGDIRAVMAAGQSFDTAVKLRCLHHTAVGLMQLHKSGVAHQDLKPSNVLVFDEGRGRVSKVGDLGRATDGRGRVWHDDLPIAGDCTYAPPEQLYGATPLEFGPRRMGCDLYQLGSLCAFFFAGMHMNALLTLELHPSLHWTIWSGRYEDVIAAVQDASGRALDRIGRAAPAALAEDVRGIVAYLTDPDPDLRGHPATRRSASSNNYSLERIVSDFDRLARRAAINMRKAS